MNLDEYATREPIAATIAAIAFSAACGLALGAVWAAIVYFYFPI